MRTQGTYSYRGTEGRKDGRKDGRTEGWTDGQTDGRTESQKLCPSAFLRKGGGQQKPKLISPFIKMQQGLYSNDMIQLQWH